MATITKEMMLKAAENARLQVTDEEVEKYSSQLSEILTFTEKINEINTDDVKPTTHGTTNTSVMRKDEPVVWDEREAALENAPEAEDGQFKVPAIME